MGLYWLILVIPALGAMLGTSRLGLQSRFLSLATAGTRQNSMAMAGFAFLLVLVVGFRHEVGGDWIHYIEPLERALQLSWLEGAVAGGDPAYGLLTWVSAHLGGGVYLVNLICAMVFVMGLVVFALSSPQPWLTMCVAVPYLVIVVAMGYTRQGVAIGLAMIGLVALDQGRLLRFATWLVVAALFHKSALILLPLAVFSGRKNWGAVLGVLLIAALMFALLLAEYVDFLVAGYLSAQYESSGAAIRIAMNALPAGIFLLLRKRFGLTNAQHSFWTWMSLGALIFIALLAVSPSSTAVDRVALYWIPLQLFVWSRLPQAMGQRADTQRQWVALVLVYAFAVQFVWLFYADHSYAWLPYQFYPWVWLWS
jgi:EpsG family